MKITLKEIASLVGGEIEGDAGTIITGASGIKEAVEGDLTFLANPKYAPCSRRRGRRRWWWRRG